MSCIHNINCPPGRPFMLEVEADATGAAGAGAPGTTWLLEFRPASNDALSAGAPAIGIPSFVQPQGGLAGGQGPGWGACARPAGRMRAALALGWAVLQACPHASVLQACMPTCICCRPCLHACAGPGDETAAAAASLYFVLLRQPPPPAAEPAQAAAQQQAAPAAEPLLALAPRLALPAAAQALRPSLDLEPQTPQAPDELALQVRAGGWRAQRLRAAGTRTAPAALRLALRPCPHSFELALRLPSPTIPFRASSSHVGTKVG